MKIAHLFLKKVRMALSYDTWWVEFASGSAILAWGITSWVFGGVDAHYVFFTLALIANAAFWEISGIALGLSQIGALMFNGCAIRWANAFLASWWWTFIAMSIVINFYANASVCLYIVFALANLVALIKLARLYE